ncbi:hypothetical protein BGZ83_009410 [Gryganskiella cystojenkinii]|nr:hypothetical protein BGZ83_009410 [Gryganskiella cystojenkinii]
MTTRQDQHESDSKTTRSTYSLASAPLRLLSHSFHSTANTHNSNNHANPISALHPADLEFDSYKQHTPIDQDNFSTNSEQLLQSSSSSTNQSKTENVVNQLRQLQPQPTSLPREDQSSSPLQKQELQEQQSIFFNGNEAYEANNRTPTTIFCINDEADWAQAQPSRKIVKLDEQPQTTTSATPYALTISPKTGVGVADDEAHELLERLLMPYDIRYSIFGQLNLQDIYNCQLACKLLLWATSDQSVWKRIALNLIQGEFYFDIPRTLPAKIPNWKYFCKRHLLRQRNWRKGQVQDIISLDDNYQKLTTLQIMAPYVLTGCSDGRIHLWNINTRQLLHRFQIRGEITWVEHLQEQKIVAGLGYDIEKMRSEIRLFSTETGEEIGLYEEDFWDLAICAINGVYLVASDGEGRYTTWNWKTGAKVSQFRVPDETSITEALYLVKNTILELHYDGMIRLFSIMGECYGRFTLDKILPKNQISFCWLHNDFSLVVWESSNTMAHIRLPLLQKHSPESLHHLDRSISQEEWDAQGAEVYWRHQLTHTCNFAAMGGGRFQLLYVQIFENLMDQVPIRVHSLRHRSSSNNRNNAGLINSTGGAIGAGTSVTSSISSNKASVTIQGDDGESDIVVEDEGYGWQHGEYVTAHSVNPDLEKIIQGLRPSRIDCDPEYIVVGLVQGGVRLLQFAPVDTELLEQDPAKRFSKENIQRGGTDKTEGD